MAKRNLLFLDIDGVLNNRASLEACVQRAKKDGTGYTEFEGEMFQSRLDLPCVMRLNFLVEYGSFDVVLSSTWRMGRDYKVVSRYLRQVCGCEFDLIGATPILGGSEVRGKEIEKWRVDEAQFRPFIIVDDDSDMDPHMDRLVKTKHEPGLTDNDVRKALSLIYRDEVQVQKIGPLDEKLSASWDAYNKLEEDYRK
ncbi:hypothetical protein KAT92_05690, partial [Candidatus Babeliales bacterium]|nr:hypothetical protein [Candidatus Babeliales bacterium]